jgi:hypothetical protein
VHAFLQATPGAPSPTPRTASLDTCARPRSPAADFLCGSTCSWLRRPLSCKMWLVLTLVRLRQRVGVSPPSSLTPTSEAAAALLLQRTELLQRVRDASKPTPSASSPRSSPSRRSDSFVPVRPFSATVSGRASCTPTSPPATAHAELVTRRNPAVPAVRAAPGEARRSSSPAVQGEESEGL